LLQLFKPYATTHETRTPLLPVGRPDCFTGDRL
jgi:hypothetical protein